MPAQYFLAVLYDEGKGVAPDAQKAAYWLEQAARADDAESQYKLGLRYRQGKGVIQNDQTANAWLNRACQNGWQTACELRR